MSPGSILHRSNLFHFDTGLDIHSPIPLREKRGESTMYDGRFALHLCLVGLHNQHESAMEVVSMLIERGADVNQKELNGRQGTTPLGLAVKNG